MEKLTVYGIPNCDSVKKTIELLKKKKADYSFHDYKKEGISRIKLEQWSKQAGWEHLLNRKGTTWRKTDPSVQARITNATSAIGLMMEHPSLIKRPVLEKGDALVVGYDEAIILSLIKPDK